MIQEYIECPRCERSIAIDQYGNRESHTCRSSARARVKARKNKAKFGTGDY